MIPPPVCDGVTLDPRLRHLYSEMLRFLKRQDAVIAQLSSLISRDPPRGMGPRTTVSRPVANMVRRLQVTLSFTILKLFFRVPELTATLKFRSAARHKFQLVIGAAAIKMAVIDSFMQKYA